MTKNGQCKKITKEAGSEAAAEAANDTGCNGKSDDTDAEVDGTKERPELEAILTGISLGRNWRKLHEGHVASKKTSCRSGLILRGPWVELLGFKNLLGHGILVLIRKNPDPSKTETMCQCQIYVSERIGILRFFHNYQTHLYL
jgi:hypothetical protein